MMSGDKIGLRYDRSCRGRDINLKSTTQIWANLKHGPSKASLHLPTSFLSFHTQTHAHTLSHGQLNPE